uniref:TGF_BETA_2 domain-containing protein n=1 Tax=Syphacia muris TaxID=451379 RepID=A0A0N5A7N1_9BILA
MVYSAAVVIFVTVLNSLLLIESVNVIEVNECPEKCYENSRVLNFLENQKGLTIGECPCVKAPGSSDCLSYDSRIQATSIEEALYQFPDLINYANDNKPLVERRPALGASLQRITSAESETNNVDDDYSCESIECKSCKALIVNGFAESAGINISTTEDVDQSYCQNKRNFELNRSKNLQSENRHSSTAENNSSVADQIVNLLHQSSRRRRDSQTDNDPQSLGVVTKIGCDYRKGDEISNGWTGLCNLCWQWRKLPDDYFPRFLNEVSCDDNDDSCLSGFGGCRPIFRSVTVLRNLNQTGTPDWVQQTISMNAACECQVEVGTSLHSLVVK